MEFIDIARILKESDSIFLRKLPGFVVGILKRIIREKEINQILEECENIQGYDFLVKMLAEFQLKLEVTGKENLPETSRCIFSANHPFGILDGLVLTHTVSEKYGTLKAIGNDAFVFIKPLRPFIFAVNVFGVNTKERISALDELYATNTAITHFPAGRVSRIYDGKVQDCAWQKSFISKSIIHKRDIVPIHFQGKNSQLFYFVSRFRKLLGIKLTLELILLPNEIFNKKNKTVKVTIGKPIPYELFDKSKTHQQWADIIRSYTYSLGTPEEMDFKRFAESYGRSPN
jgi:putative hemolysin